MNAGDTRTVAFPPSASTTRGKEKVGELQIVRFVAAFAVVLFHLFSSYYIDFGASRNYFMLGASGVDVFFVLSGFVIAYSVRPEMGPAYFVRRRVARIVPLYWGLTLGVAAVTLIMPALLNSTRFDILNLLKSLLFIPYQKENGLVQPMLFLGWTLNYEMWFYAIFACALALPRWNFLYPCAFVASLVVIGLLFPMDSVVYSFYVNPIMLEFVFGILLFIAWSNYWDVGRRYLPLYIITFIVFAVLAGHFSSQVARPLTMGIAALALVAAALSVNLAKGPLISVLLLLGDASYSLYLSHPYIIQVFTKLAKGQNIVVLAMLSIITLLLTLVTSVVLYRMIELPGRRWIMERFWYSPARA